MSKAPQVHPQVAAIAVIAIVDAAEDYRQHEESIELPEDIRASYKDTPEPYRWAMDTLGWAEYDGTPWWSEVMDLIG